MDEQEAGEVSVRILRYNPEGDAEPRWESYRVPTRPFDCVLDALHHVKWYVDGSLTFRRSCAHGMCGSDAMWINGRNRLACKTLIKDLDPPLEVAPLPGFTVEKDLVVDMEPFFQSYRRVLPYLIDDGPPPERERLQSPVERGRYDDTTKCILCAACTTACPIFLNEGNYIGPAAIVAAHRFIFDSRDGGAAERLEIMAAPDGAFRCQGMFKCTESCPRGIKVTKAIQQVKRAIADR